MTRLQNIFIGLILSFPVLIMADFRADIRQNEVKIMPGEFYAFFSHATSDWDREHKTEPTVLSMIKYSNDQKIQTIATVHSDAFVNQFNEASFYFISNETIDYIMHSEGGQHRLKFPNAKALIVAGGNLHVCLCESIRDIVAGLSPIRSDKNIFLVEEAIFDNDFEKMPETEQEMSQFVDGFLFPNFPCSNQVSTGFGPIDTSDFNIKFFYHGKLLKELRPDGLDRSTISIRFEKWDQVRLALSQIGASK
jgi:hypothetical protein